MEAHRHEDFLMTGRPATDDVIPGAFALSVGMPDLPAPDGWRWVKLTDVARLESGHTPSRKHPEYWDGDIRWLGIQDARQHHGREIHETRQTVSELGVANSSARILPAGTVCLSRTASVGYVVRLGRPMATSQDFVNWVCSDDVDPEFLMYLLIAEAESILRFGKGSTHTTVYFPEVKAFHICLPQPEEQRRIVAKVEALLARVNAARDRLARVPAILERFRQSVLAAACSGRLTEDWRSPTAEPPDRADEWLRKQAEVSWALTPTGSETVDFDQAPELPESWSCVPLERLSRRIGDVNHRMPSAAEQGIPLVSTKDFQGTEHIDFAGAKKITGTDYLRMCRKIKPERGDILVSRYGTVGEVRKVDFNDPFQVSYSIAIVKPSEAANLTDYLLLALRSPFVQAQMTKETRASAQPDLGLRSIRQLSIPLPQPSERDEIVRRVETLSALADTIEQRATTAHRRADHLTQSILSKAYRGELLPGARTGERTAPDLRKVCDNER